MVEAASITPKQYGAMYRLHQLRIAANRGKLVDFPALENRVLLAELAFVSVRDEPGVPATTRVPRILAGMQPEDYDAIGVSKAAYVLNQVVEIADTLGSHRILNDEQPNLDNTGGQ
jgi:hypothetical protein